MTHLALCRPEMASFLHLSVMQCPGQPLVPYTHLPTMEGASIGQLTREVARLCVPLEGEPHIPYQTFLLRAHGGCTHAFQTTIEPNVLFHCQPVARGDGQRLLGVYVCVSEDASPLSLPPSKPTRTHMSNSTLYCGQMPRWGRMADMLVCTSWPRMEAEPLLGGKRPLKMDLWVRGSEKWPFMEERSTHTFRAPSTGHPGLLQPHCLGDQWES